jgi:hypothetical protein
VDEHGVAYRIRWKWPRIMAVPLAVFAVAWDSFLVSWYFGVLTQEGVPVGMIVFPIAHVAVGLVLPYVALAFWMNSTLIEVESGELRCRHQPLPFPGSRTLRVAEIQQFFCVHRAGRKGASAFDVMVRLAGDRETKLVGGLQTEREARFIEERLESRLALSDRPIAGELAR